MNKQLFSTDVLTPTTLPSKKAAVEPRPLFSTVALPNEPLIDPRPLFYGNPTVRTPLQGPSTTTPRAYPILERE